MDGAYVFSIEEFSVYDGPGIRTSVFLKGCPLKCSWCHNPEGQSFSNEILKAQSGCIGCGACLRAGQEETGSPCVSDASIGACPNRLLRYCAEFYTPESLVKRLEGYFDIVNLSGGGITFSGGEPLAQPHFVESCLKLLQGRVHTAIQTSGYCEKAVFDRVLALADYFLFDIKLADEQDHIRYTGVSNRKILRNFAALCQSGKAFTVRTPLIPGVTDTPENLSGIADILTANGIRRIELLPYNKAAGGKYASIGREFTPDYDENTPVNADISIFTTRGIEAVIL